MTSGIAQAPLLLQERGLAIQEDFAREQAARFRGDQDGPVNISRAPGEGADRAALEESLKGLQRVLLDNAELQDQIVKTSVKKGTEAAIRKTGGDPTK